MKIGIQQGKGFSKRWISYCRKQGIPFKLVDCYRSDIIKQLKDCTALMWHFSHSNYKDVLFAKQLIYSLQTAEKRVFPDFNTAWHFDDKVGQKYLLESIGAPLVPSYVFYNKKEALDWALKTNFPKVFKLRGGAGSANVRLVKTQNQAIRLIKKAFGKGFSQFNKLVYLKERFRLFREGKDNILGVFKGFGRLLIPPKFSTFRSKEKGYIYFQDFLSGNFSDTRVIVIGERAFAIKRFVRKNDFRASGSGFINFDPNQIDKKCIQLAFETNKKLKAQCLAYDFVFLNNEPLIVEISFGFSTLAYDSCPGFWDADLNWHQKTFNPQEWMVDLVWDKKQK